MGREMRRQVVSHLEHAGKRVGPAPPLLLLQHLQVPSPTGPQRGGKKREPGVEKSGRAGSSGDSRGEVAGFAGRAEMVRPGQAQLQKLHLGNTCRFPGNWKRP